MTGDNNRQPVAIIGGGITGLTAAWELQKNGIPYTLFEASDRLGGKVVTEYNDGFTIEGGPDSFLTSKPWAWQLCDELGLRERMIGTNDAQRNVFILKGGKLHPFPKGMRLIVPVEESGLLASELLSEAGKRRMLAEVDLQPYDAPADESLASFMRRHFGQEAVDTFVEPLLAGIYVGDPEKMSVRATYPQYVEMERTHGSLIRAMRSAPPTVPDPLAPKTAFFSLKGGTQELIDTLASQLTGDIRLNTPVNMGLDEFSSGGSYSAVIVTILSDAIMPTGSADFRAAYQQMMAQPMANSTVVSLGYCAADVPFDLNGFGFVIPSAEPTPMKACTWSSTKLVGRAPQDSVLIRIFLKGTNLDKPTATDQARLELERLMGVPHEVAPVVDSLYLWKNPAYTVGHLERIFQLEQCAPAGVYFAGSPYRGVGVPDCVHQSQIAAQKAIAHLTIKNIEHTNEGASI
jgi:oxygen-dependent protoporphyrinogen oxidase